MTGDNVSFMEPETKEEALAVNELLLKMREEKRKREKVKMTISSVIIDAINEIGLPEVKNIVRELYKELRN